MAWRHVRDAVDALGPDADVRRPQLDLGVVPAPSRPAGLVADHAVAVLIDGLKAR